MRPHLATLVEDFERHSREIAIVTHRGNRRIVSTYGEVAALARRFAARILRNGSRLSSDVCYVESSSFRSMPQAVLNLQGAFWMIRVLSWLWVMPPGSHSCLKAQ